MPSLIGPEPLPWSSAAEFRELARREMSARFATPLAPSRVPGHPLPLGLVSEDRTLVGAILEPPRAMGGRLSTAQRAELSEKVMLLALTPAQQRVLVVGHPRAQLEPWFAVYGALARDIEFWRLRGPGSLERLHVW